MPWCERTYSSYQLTSCPHIKNQKNMIIQCVIYPVQQFLAIAGFLNQNYYYNIMLPIPLTMLDGHRFCIRAEIFPSGIEPAPFPVVWVQAGCLKLGQLTIILD